MPNENIDLTVRLREARKFVGDTKAAAGGVKNIGGAVEDVDRKAKKTERSVHRLRGSFSLLGGGARLAIGTVGGAAGIYGVAGALKLMYDEGRDAQRTGKQTDAALKSTGGVANVSAKQLGAYAMALSNISGVDDEAIQGGENMLLTFRNIRNEAGKGNDIFKQTTSTMVDFAARFTHGDQVRSAVMLGKALDNPIKGMNALQRVGVSFDKQSQERVKTLVAHNDLLGAQKIILGQIQPQVKGFAKASTDPMQKLNTSFHNLAETAGTALLPEIDKGAKSLSKFIQEMQSGKGNGGEFVHTMKDIGQAVGPPLKDMLNMGIAVGKFVGKHPELAKIGGELVAIGLAVKTIRFAGSITGVTGLLNGLQKIPGAATRADQKVAETFSASRGARRGRLWGTAFGKAGSVAIAAVVVAESPNILASIGDSLLGKGNAFSEEARKRGFKDIPSLIGINPESTSAHDTVTGRTAQQRANRRKDPNYQAYLERQRRRRAHTRRPRVSMPKVASAGIPMTSADVGGQIVESLQPIQLFLDGKLLTEVVGKHTRHARNHK